MGVIGEVNPTNEVKLAWAEIITYLMYTAYMTTDKNKTNNKKKQQPKNSQNL